MKKIPWLVSGLVLVAFFGSCWMMGRLGVFPSTPVQAQSIPPNAAQIQKDLASQSIRFDPVEPLQAGTAILSEDQAIAAVNHAFPRLQELKPTATTANLGRLSKPLLQAGLQEGMISDDPFVNPKLVWIVTLSGVQMKSSGGNGRPVLVSNELNVVIDASTGDRLMDYVWTR